MKYYRSINPVIKSLFYFASLYAIVFDFYLVEVFEEDSIWKTLLTVIERLCFSFIATIIFFIINQHYPKVKKKEKTNAQLKLIIQKIQIETIDLFGALGLRTNFREFVTQEILDAAFKGRSNKEVVQGKGFTTSKYPADEYVTMVMQRIGEHIQDVLLFHETIDNDILEKLLLIKSTVDDRRRTAFHSQHELPLDWESYQLSVISEKTFEIVTKLFTKEELGLEK